MSQTPLQDAFNETRNHSKKRMYKKRQKAIKRQNKRDTYRSKYMNKREKFFSDQLYETVYHMIQQRVNDRIKYNSIYDKNNIKVELTDHYYPVSLDNISRCCKMMENYKAYPEIKSLQPHQTKLQELLNQFLEEFPDASNVTLTMKIVPGRCSSDDCGVCICTQNPLVNCCCFIANIITCTLGGSCYEYYQGTYVNVQVDLSFDVQ